MSFNPAERELLRIARTLPPGQLRSVFPSLPPARAHHWEGVLDGARHACGCREGAVGALMGVAAALAAMLVIGALTTLPLWAACMLLAAALLLGTAAGKRVGLKKAET